MPTLTMQDVITLHTLIMRDEGAPDLMLSLAGLESALQRPLTAAHYEGADLAKQTAVLISGIALAHVFVDGNKRTAAASALLFLALAGYQLADRSAAFGEAILALVNRDERRSQAERIPLAEAEEQLATWIRERLEPRN
jgi:death-on-curing protein